jgi:hypothetical protein
MARRHEYNHDDDNKNTKISARDRSSGLSLLGNPHQRCGVGRAQIAVYCFLSRKEDSPLLAPHLCRGQVLLSPTAVAASHFSQTINGVGRSATSRPFRGQ